MTVSRDEGNLDRNRVRDFYAMPIKLYYREYSKTDQENETVPAEGSYKTTDKATLNYLRNHDPNIPYSINTVHLQNPYKSTQRLEGYATRENFKVRPASVKVIHRFASGLIILFVKYPANLTHGDLMRRQLTLT